MIKNISLARNRAIKILILTLLEVEQSKSLISYVISHILFSSAKSVLQNRSSFLP